MSHRPDGLPPRLDARPFSPSSYGSWDGASRSTRAPSPDKDLPPLPPTKPLPQLPVADARARSPSSSSAASSLDLHRDLEMNGGAVGGQQQSSGYAQVLQHEDRLLGAADKPQRRRRAGTLTIDGSVVDVDAPDFDPAQLGKMLADKAFLRSVLINAGLIALWYIFSISISVYNKWMFSKTNTRHSPGGRVVFPFPLFTTSFHMLVQFSLASLVLYWFPKFRPQNQVDPDARRAHSTEDQDVYEEEPKPLVTPMFYLTRIAPCGAATGLDIGLGNTSLKFITLTFFTMCKSSTLGFVLLFAIIFGLEKPSWRLGAIIFVMTIGVIMMVAGEAAFDIIGFILLMLASFFSGLRWSLTQILLRRNPATSNPFASLFYLTPIMFLVLLLIALPSEGLHALKTGFDVLTAAKGLPLATLILLFPGVLAFLMVSAEFALLKRTSVVTLSVCGIFKEVITITAAGIIFGDDLTPINISGLCVTIAAIAAYNFVRVRAMRKDTRQEVQRQMETEERTPMFDAERLDAHQPTVTSPLTSSAAQWRRQGSLEGPPTLAGVVRHDAVEEAPRVSPLKRWEDIE